MKEDYSYKHTIQSNQVESIAVRNLKCSSNILKSHMSTLNAVLSTLMENGLSCSAEKFEFLQYEDRTYFMYHRCIRAAETFNKMIADATFCKRYSIQRFQSYSVLMPHLMIHGQFSPIANDSQTLSSQQGNHSQLEKEDIAVIFRIKKTNQYLYGRKFELITYNQCHVSHFDPRQKFPVLAAQRIQRLAMILLGKDYTVKYRSTQEHTNADSLSRLPV
ncbi:hypothetical protein RF11_16052 [Thelohanellus kitauei]|uniref:Reverse transcriptase RNase H-like domain-containing protein n=1 Tax=Thelohanellus kitauei TaxID=669202 RepID=A0A0C2MRU0_THEKT|nr:hypothetical protein RF11_16052 [Thelohanellus kitauei]